MDEFVGQNRNVALVVVKFAFLVVTLIFAAACVIYFQGNEYYRTGVFFFYLVLGCVVYSTVYFYELKKKLLEKFSAAKMRRLSYYAIVKMAIGLLLIVVGIIGGITSHLDYPESFNLYYAHTLAGGLGLFWSLVFYIDARRFILQLTTAQGDKEVFHNEEFSRPC